MKNTYQESRRDFVKKLSAIAGSAALLGSVPWISHLQAAPPGKTDTVRIGVIGVGSRGKFLLQRLLLIEGVEVAAVCDNYEPHFERAKQLTQGKAKAFKDYRKVLEMKDLHAVVIATPLHQHAHITIDAFDAGKHVFCEKSMARTPNDCKNMVLAQQRNQKVFQIGHQRLFHPVYLDAIVRIKQGEIGDVTQIRAYWHRNRDWRRPVPSPELERKINWRLYLDYSCGLMTELASHQVQVGNWIWDEHPVSVMGSGSVNYWKDGREVYDNVNLIYVFPGGKHLIYDSLTSNKFYGLEEQIMGPKGTMELEHNKVYTENPPPAPGIKQLINQIERSVFETVPLGGASWIPELGSEADGKPVVDKYPLPDENTIQLESFAQSVRQNKPSDFLIRQGYYASIAALLGHQAMREDKIIRWNYDLNII